MKVKVLKPFYDASEEVFRHAGDVFTCSDKRWNEIKSNISSHVEAVEKTKTADIKQNQAEETEKKATKKWGK